MIELGQYSSSFDKRDEHVNVNAIWLNQARPFFGVNREAWDPRMGNKVGDTFFDIYTFTAHSNKVGDTFHDLYTFTDHSNEWASFF